MRNKFYYISVFLILLVSCGTKKSLTHKPLLEGYAVEKDSVQAYPDTLYVLKDNILKHSPSGHWQLYVEGDALERGMIIGSLTKNLLHYQENVFFGKVKEIVPSKFKQRLLRGFLKWYNRKLYTHIKEEYKTEIYGLSRYSSNEYNYIAKPYLRSLYLHGAHDIGHALQDLALVGCSSFAAWGDKTVDGNLIIGRNFDFYAGDDFAKNKIIAFIKPKKGVPFMMVTWAGMIGAVSGMNQSGLTVTLNAGKSDMPLIAKTPISLLAREILQYANTIEEAIEIAKTRQVFVSESIMVGSAIDNKAVLIEVSPNNFGVYDVVNSSQLICSNHFQSEAYKEDENNLKHIKESHSKYRFDKMNELFSKNNKITPTIAVDILRDKSGLEGRDIGFGNEKSLNQLLAHHGIVFQPSKKKVWVSTNPYQLGKFIAYDLDEIFSETFSGKFEDKSLEIKEDAFMHTKAFQDYEKYRKEDRVLDDALKNKEVNLTREYLKEYIALNPELWIVYYKVGKYYYNKKWYAMALPYFEKALSKEVTTVPDLENIKKHLKKCKQKIAN